MTVKRICSPLGSSNNTSSALTVIEADEDVIVSDCDAIVCVSGDAVVTLPDHPSVGAEVKVVADGGDATVVGGANDIADGPFTVKNGTATSFVFSCEGAWVPECCSTTGPTGPTGAAGVMGATGATGSSGSSVLVKTTLRTLDVNVTTSSNTFVNLFSFLYTSGASFLIVEWIVGLLLPASTGAEFRFLVDNVQVGNTVRITNGSAAPEFEQISDHLRVLVAAGIHFIQVQWQVESGSGTLSVDAGDATALIFETKA